MMIRRPPAPITPVALRAWTATGAHGHGIEALASLLAANRSALRANDLPGITLSTAIGRVDGLESLPWSHDWAAWDSRGTRLAWWGLQADGFVDTVARAREHHGPGRIGLVLGTSSSTIAVSEAAYRALDDQGRFPAALRHPDLNTPHAITAFVQQVLVDAVVAAGVDALGGSLLYGFHALGVLGRDPCRPFDAARHGISIGEAAVFALVERGEAAVMLQGHGESNDAHHMSTPHPQGLGAERALDDALARAGLDGAAIEFLNLHGTASAANDEVEAALVARRYAPTVHACATKGLSGHTMGAAGLLEAMVCALAVERGLLAGSAPTLTPDPAFGPAFAERWHAQPTQCRIRHAVSHSFGFGGNNCVLVLGC
jgi:3-oxoacyl-[acyl-carrier-protein] synthase-1